MPPAAPFLTSPQPEGDPSPLNSRQLLLVPQEAGWQSPAVTSQLPQGPGSPSLSEFGFKISTESCTRFRNALGRKQQQQLRLWLVSAAVPRHPEAMLLHAPREHSAPCTGAIPQPKPSPCPCASLGSELGSPSPGSLWSRGAGGCPSSRSCTLWRVRPVMLSPLCTPRTPT